MDIEINIGRSVEGENACLVPPTCNGVSRRHATLRWHDGIVTLVDNGSKNGTFVNGKRVSQVDITENDTVCLGGTGADSHFYQLDLKKLFASFPYVTPHANNVSAYSFQFVQGMKSDDYSKEFEQVKQAYIEYHSKLSKLQRKANKRMQLPRVLLSAIPALLGITVMIFMYKNGNGMIGFVAMSAGTVLSGLIGTLTMGRSSIRQEKLSEDILDLQLKYQKEYKCPKCGKEYSLDLHWKRLQAEGKCPHGCGAKFV